jgi:hypothetical protein
MKWYCQNPCCGFETEVSPTVPMLWNCPKCGGTNFANIKDAQEFFRQFKVNLFPSEAVTYKVKGSFSQAVCPL